MRTVMTTLAILWLMGFPVQARTPSPVSAQVPVPAPQEPIPAPPVSQQPPPTVPGPAGSAPVVVPPPVVPPIPLGARTFLGPTGIIFSAVRPDRVVDFEMVVGYLEAALETSTDPGVRAQAAGWRVLKATEPGPNSTVLYMFLIDPTVPGADYGLGRILSDAYPDQIQDIWKLYTGALAGGGSLLNLAPVQPAPLPPVTSPLTAPAPTPRPSPPAQ